MPDFKGPENFRLVLAFIVPGLIILFIRSRFIVGRLPTPAERFLNYLVLSLVYYVLTIPFLEQALRVDGPWYRRAVVWVMLTVLGPAVFGGVLGIIAQKEWIARTTALFGIHLIDVVPSAWDWRFSTRPEGRRAVAAARHGCMYFHSGKRD